MKILAAVYNPIAYDGRVQRECEALAQAGEVELLCPQGPDVPAGLPFRVTPVRLASSGTVRRHLAFASAVVRRARAWRPDLVHAHDFFMAGPGALAAAVSGAGLIYDAHELIIPEARRRMSRRARFWYAIERWAIGRADLVIAANEERADLMREHYALRQLPLVVRNIPPDPGALADAGGPALRRSPVERLCVYQGDVSLKRGLGIFLSAVPCLPRDVRMLIVGSGPDEQAVREDVTRRGMQERVTLLGRVARQQLHAILRSCDVGLICYPFDGLNNVYCAPNKIFEYAQAGLPVVATRQPPLARMLSTYGVGLALDPQEEPGSVAAKIVQVIENAPAYRAGLSRLLSENTWTSEAERLRAAVCAIATGRAR